MKYIHFLFCFFILSFIFSCEKEKEKVDPCKDVKPFKASFTMSEEVSDSFFKIQDHKILYYSAVKFEADETYDSYEWKLGGDPRVWTSRSFQVRFANLDPFVEVRLIAKKKANACFPNDRIIDTITDYFSVTPIRDAKIWGKYSGYFMKTPTEKDTFELRQFFSTQPNDPFPSNSRFINIPKGCNVIPVNGFYANLSGGYGYAYFKFNDPSNYVCKCGGPKAFGILNSDSIKIKFSYSPDINNSTFILSDIFIGKRVQ
jgi:hypothetical protein